VPATLEQLSPSRVKLTIEIPFADLRPHLNKAYQDIAAQVSVPGFRKGKVPPAIIDQRVGRGYVLQEAINAALSPAYAQAIAETEITPLDQPDIEITKLEDNDLVEFTAEVDVRPDFDLPDFSALEVTVDALPDTQAELESRLELLRERFATSVEVERAAAVGDLANISLQARQNGEVIEDGTSEDVIYVVGNQDMLEGLSDAVVGLGAGQSKEFKASLVGGSHEGEEADITVTVNKVSERTLPEVDDEFASLVSEFDTVAQMREDLQTKIVEAARIEQMSQGRDRVIDQLVAKTQFELPERTAENEIADRKAGINNQLKQAGLTLATYLERAGEYTQAQSEEEFWAQLEESARKSLKAQLILDKIVEEGSVEISENDLGRMLVSRAMENGSTPEQEAQHMVEHNHFNEWVSQIRRNKALETVIAAATVKDENGNIVDIAIPVPEEDIDEDEGEA
jgi:trigger factor